MFCSAEKMPIFKHPNFDFLFPFFWCFGDYFNRSGSKTLSSILKFRTDLDSIVKPGLRQVPKQVFKKLILPRGKLHLTRKSEDFLQWGSNFWGLAWEPVETPVWRWNRGQCEISVSKIGFRIQIYWNSQRHVKKVETKSQNSGVFKMGIFRPKKIWFFWGCPGFVRLL